MCETIYICSFFKLQLQCSPCTHICVLHIVFATAPSAGTGFLPGSPAGHLMTFPHLICELQLTPSI